MKRGEWGGASSLVTLLTLRAFGNNEKFCDGARNTPHPFPLPQGEREVLICPLP